MIKSNLNGLDVNLFTNSSDISDRQQFEDLHPIINSLKALSFELNENYKNLNLKVNESVDAGNQEEGQILTAKKFDPSDKERETNGKPRDKTTLDSLQFLKNFLKQRNLLTLLALHQKLSKYKIKRTDENDLNNNHPSSNVGITERKTANSHQYIIDPIAIDDVGKIVFEISQDCIEMDREPSEDVCELFEILQKTHFNTLLQAHDMIAHCKYYPTLPDIPNEVDEDDTKAIKIVQLIKNTEPLGATIRVDDETNAVYIARVMHGGAADRSGLIHAGDEVHEINGIHVRGQEPDKIIEILSTVNGSLTMKLAPNGANTRSQSNNSNEELNEQDKMMNATTERSICMKTRRNNLKFSYLRAMFDYDPFWDKNIPCQLAGLSFSKGDILEIVSQEDRNWWQARHKRKSVLRAGLIPSPAYQTEHNLLSKSAHNDQFFEKSCETMNGDSNINRKIRYQPYQPVFLYQPTKSLSSYIPRTIILVGVPGVGRKEIRRQVVHSNPGKFQIPVPHTTRPRQPNEREGVDFYFLTKEQYSRRFQKAADSCSMLMLENNNYSMNLFEYRDGNGDRYAVDMESINEVRNQGKFPILCPTPDQIPTLYRPDLKPFIILVLPPCSTALKYVNNKTTSSPNHRRILERFPEIQLEVLEAETTCLKTRWGCYFDDEVINDNLSAVIEYIRKVAEHLENDEQWLPEDWK